MVVDTIFYSSMVKPLVQERVSDVAQLCVPVADITVGVDYVDCEARVRRLKMLALPLIDSVIILCHARVLVLCNIFHIGSGVPSSVPVPYYDVKSLNIKNALLD